MLVAIRVSLSPKRRIRSSKEIHSKGYMHISLDDLIRRFGDSEKRGGVRTFPPHSRMLEGRWNEDLIRRFGDCEKRGGIPFEDLIRLFGDCENGGPWIYRLARGVCLDPVKDRELAASRGAMKNFARSKTGVLKDMAAVELWLRELLGQ
ncbi:hypothetical protein T484DRAFT_1832866, partial [Baffinella frigidus]